MIGRETIPFRAILGFAAQRQGIDVARCRVVLELLSTAGSLRDTFRGELANVALSEVDLAVLVTLYAIAPDRMSLAHLAAQVGAARPSMTDVADRLEARALIRRERAVGDRRTVLVELTAAGRELTERGLGVMIDHAQRIGRVVNAQTEGAIVEACRCLAEAVRACRNTDALSRPSGTASARGRTNSRSGGAVRRLP